MSTSYQYLKSPITSIRVDRNCSHSRITIFINHANAGTLTVRVEEEPGFLYLLSENADDTKCPLRTSYGGKDVGCVVTENVRGLDPLLVLIDEYGRPVTVGEIQAMAGK